MINKSLGYALAAIGAVGLAISFDAVRKAIKLTLPAFLSNNVLMILGVILLVVGLFLATRGSAKKQPVEVPIYEGKNIVGYRRVK